MNTRNTIAKTLACGLLTLTASIAWANDGSGGFDLGDTETKIDGSTDKIVDFDRDQTVRFREEGDETSYMLPDAPDHSDPSQTGNEFDPTHDHVPAPPDVQKAGDLNGDDIINTDDLLLVVNSWGASCKESDGKALLADVAPEGGDCIVDIDDALVVLMNWGS